MTHVKYIPAHFVEGTRSYVYYRVQNPATEKLEPFRHYFDRVKDLRVRRLQARSFVREINDKLDHGWTPWETKAAPHLAKPLKEMLVHFMTTKEKILRPRSIPTYRSRTNKLLAFMEKVTDRIPVCHQLTPLLANTFMDGLMVEGLKARTHNNYLMDMKSLGNWAVKRGYWHNNPFADITHLRNGAVEKRPLSDDEMSVMLTDIAKTRPAFMIVCGLVYYCALRPEEISHIKVDQVDIHRGMVRVTSASTKDHDGTWITVPAQFLPELVEHIKGQPGKNYLVSVGYLSGETRKNPKSYAETWQKHRERLNLPVEIKLYSLKDTALLRFAEQGADIVKIRDHARHSSAAITDVYLKTLRGYVDKEVRDAYPDIDR